MNALRGRTTSVSTAKLSLPVKTEKKLTSHQESAKQIKEIKLFTSTLAVSAKYFLTLLRKKNRKPTCNEKKQ